MSKTCELKTIVYEACVGCMNSYHKKWILNETELQASIYHNIIKQKIKNEKTKHAKFIVYLQSLMYRPDKKKKDKIVKPDLIIRENPRSKRIRLVMEIKNDNQDLEGNISTVSLPKMYFDIHKLKKIRISEDKNNFYKDSILLFVIFLKKKSIDRVKKKLIYEVEHREKTGKEQKRRISEREEMIKNFIVFIYSEKDLQAEWIEWDRNGIRKDGIRISVDLDEIRFDTINLSELRTHCQKKNYKVLNSKKHLIKEILSNEPKHFKDMHEEYKKKELQKICDILCVNRTGNKEKLIAEIKKSISS